METIIRDDKTHMVDAINIDILLPPDFSEKYKTAVIRAAESCTVRKHLASPPAVRVFARQES